MKLEHPLIGIVIRKCVFFNFANKNIIICWVPSRIGIRGNEKVLLSSVLWICLVPRLVYPIMVLNIVSQYILSTWQEDWNGAVAHTLNSGRLAVLIQAVQEM